MSDIETPAPPFLPTRPLLLGCMLGASVLGGCMSNRTSTGDAGATFDSGELGDAATTVDSGGLGDSGAPGCQAALFCDDFESYAVAAPPGGPWQAQLKLGAVIIDDAQHSSGSRAAKFSTEAQSGTKRAYLRLPTGGPLPIAGNAFYGRMMFLLESAPTASVHWTFIQAGGTVAGQNSHALYRYGGQQPVTTDAGFVGSQLMANYDTPDSYSGVGPSSDCYKHAQRKVVPVGRWSCVEWQFDGPNDTMRLWLDGQPLDNLTVAGTGQGCVNQPATFPWTAPTFEYIDLGWESYQTDEARTLWIDDVVISATPIGCPPATP